MTRFATSSSKGRRRLAPDPPRYRLERRQVRGCVEDSVTAATSTTRTLPSTWIAEHKVTISPTRVAPIGVPAVSTRSCSAAYRGADRGDVPAVGGTGPEVLQRRVRRLADLQQRGADTVEDQRRLRLLAGVHGALAMLTSGTRSAGRVQINRADRPVLGSPVTARPAGPHHVRRFVPPRGEHVGRCLRLEGWRLTREISTPFVEWYARRFERQ